MVLSQNAHRQSTSITDCYTGVQKTGLSVNARTIILSLSSQYYRATHVTYTRDNRTIEIIRRYRRVLGDVSSGIGDGDHGYWATGPGGWGHSLNHRDVTRDKKKTANSRAFN